MGEPDDDDRAAYQKIEELLSNEGPLTERAIRERLVTRKAISAQD